MLGKPNLPKMGKLCKQTYKIFTHAYIALPVTNYLVNPILWILLHLSSFLRTDPLEHHFGLSVK